MKSTRLVLMLGGALLLGTLSAQVVSNGVVKRKTGKDSRKEVSAESAGPNVTDRMKSFYENKAPHDADLTFMKEVYRELDLKKVENAPLYYPEDIVDGKMNMFRVLLGAVVDGRIPAYEYLDGREVFSDQYKIKVGEMLDRFGIYYTKGKAGKAEFQIAEADVPITQVNSYYIIEKWEFDRRTNKMRTRVEAICPILTKVGDFGGETKYPMFWVKFDVLRPFLASQYVFCGDDNNIESCSLDDYFTLGKYDGEIYKTKNLRNLSMAQLYPDEDMRKRAQDSIEKRLREFGKNLWVPTREEHLARLEEESKRAAAIASGDSIPGRTVVTDKTSSTDKTTTKVRTSVKRAKTPKTKVSEPKQSNTTAVRSVRRRK